WARVSMPRCPSAPSPPTSRSPAPRGSAASTPSPTASPRWAAPPGRWCCARRTARRSTTIRTRSMRPWTRSRRAPGSPRAPPILGEGVDAALPLGTFSTDIEIPGTEGQRGIDTLAHRFPEMGGTSGQVVLRAQDGTTVDDHQDEIDALMDEIAEIDGVAAAPSPLDEVSPGTRNDDDTALIAQFQMDGQTGEFPAESVDEITALVDGADTAALDASIGGQVLQSAEIPFGAG